MGLLAVFLVVPYSVLAQEPACQHRILPIAVRDAQNLPIPNVSPVDLQAKVHGKPVKILSLSPDTRPHRLVLILDASGSMGGETGESARWKLALLLARHFFNANNHSSPIALLIFNNQVTDAVPFAAGNSAVAAKLLQIDSDPKYIKANIKGMTALRDTALRALALLDHPNSGDAIYVLTDGVDNASKHSSSDLNGRLAVASVRLFAILLESRRESQRTSEEGSPPSELAETARKSGGEILSAAQWQGSRVALSADTDGKFKVEETLSRLYQTMVQDSLLEVQLPLPITKTEHWELKLSDTARRQWKGAQLTYPSSLLSCSAEVYGSGRH